MKKIITFLLLLFSSVIGFSQKTAWQENRLQYVNPLVGTDSQFEFWIC